MYVANTAQSPNAQVLLKLSLFMTTAGLGRKRFFVIIAAGFCIPGVLPQWSSG